MLEKINSPEDVKKLKLEEKEQLAEDSWRPEHLHQIYAFHC